MDARAFEDSVKNQLARCREVMLFKNNSYTPGADKLANFRTAAALQGNTLMQALHGMRAKHTESTYRMVASGLTYPLDVWTEKITDEINYLLLLKAAVDEEADILAKEEHEQHALFDAIDPNFGRTEL